MLRQGRTVVIPDGKEERQKLLKPLVNKFVQVIVFSFVVMGLSLGLFFAEREWRLTQAAVAHMSYAVRSLGYEPTASAAQVTPLGAIVHYTTKNFDLDPLVDADFNFGVRNSFKLRRVTEYCQWVETFEDKKDGQGNTLRTFFYGSKWLPRPLSSIKFDQPARHNNPQRDPFPSTTFSVANGRLGPFMMGGELLEQQNELPWKHIGYDVQALQSVAASPAATEHKFYPIGNGYFYSAYQESMFERVAKLAGMAMEGSMDIQLADFFQECNAGDIRVHYEATDATTLASTGVSVIAEVWDQFILGVHISPSGQRVGVVVPGIHMDTDALLERFISSSSWGLWFARFTLTPLIAFFSAWALSSPTSLMRIIALSIEIWLMVFSFANGFNEMLYIASKNMMHAGILVLVFVYASLSAISQSNRMEQRLKQQQGQNGMPEPSAPPLKED